MRNRHRITDEYYKPQPLRPIFEQNELEQGIWIELIPHKLKVVIVEPGTGPTPKVGEFIRLKQFVYLDSMVNIKQQRITYTFGRKRLLPGLEFCLSLCRQSFKGRFYIDSSLAYGKKTVPGIPPNSNLVIDVEINAITVQPLSTGEYDDQQFLTEIIAKARDGDSSARTGNYTQAQRYYEYAFQRIQSTRCKQIKNYLYNQSKISYMINNGEKTESEISKEIKDVVEMYKIFDIIKIKAVEMALLNRDYYKVVVLTRQCMMESRLEQNERVVAARARAFAEIGEFEMAIEIMRHLHDKSPNEPAYEVELKRIEEKQKEFNKYTMNMNCEPVLALTIPNIKNKPKRRRKERAYYEDEDYQADEEQTMKMEPMELGMHIGYQDLSYFD